MGNITLEAIAIFIGVVLLSAIIFSAINITHLSEQIPEKIYDPFPNVSPITLPSNINNTDSCYYRPRSCEKDDTCTVCGNPDDFQCITVTDSENAINSDDVQYTDVRINNTKLAPGKWCVPRFQDDYECNPFTGQWTWEADPECYHINGKSQCWKCICKYPNLYYDNEGCSTDLLCAGGRNALILTKEGSDDLKQKGMDVTAGTGYKPTTDQPKALTDMEKILLHSTSPYDADAAGNPYYKCDCTDGKTVQINPDYYQCRDFECGKFIGEEVDPTSSTWDVNTQTCKCIGSTETLVTAGKAAGVCYNPTIYCQPGTWDNNTEKCTVDANSGWEYVPCNSQYVTHPGVTLSCTRIPNPIGYETIDHCKDKRNPAGDCSGHGHLLYNTKTKKCSCICVGGGTFTDRFNAKISYKWSGSECNDQCFDNGTTLASYDGNWTVYYPKSKCCSGHCETVSSFPSTDIVCSKQEGKGGCTVPT